MPGKSLKPSKPCVLGIKSQFLNVHLVSISSVSKALAAKMLFATYDVTNTTHLLPAREETKPGAGNGCKYCWWWKCLKSHQAGHYHADGRRRWIFQGWGITTVLQSRGRSGNNLLKAFYEIQQEFSWRRFLFLKLQDVRKYGACSVGFRFR